MADVDLFISRHKKRLPLGWMGASNLGCVTLQFIYIGIIATVGTDTKGVIKDITDQLAFFKYKVEEIVVSKQIISQFESDPPLFTSEYDRISHYMNLELALSYASSNSSKKKFALVIVSSCCAVFWNDGNKTS